MALGANSPDFSRLVMTHGFRLTAGGVELGAVAAVALTRVIADLPYKVSPLDPLTFGSAFAVMASVSLVACFLPALAGVADRSASRLAGLIRAKVWARQTKTSRPEVTDARPHCGSW